MGFFRLTILLIGLLCTISALQGKLIIPSTVDLKDNIKHLLEITQVKNEYMVFLQYMKLSPPKDEKMKSLYSDLFSFDSYVNDLTQIYAKYYTLDDIIHLIEFYCSPLGKKTLQINHELNKQMKDIMLTKISDYIFALKENGYSINLPLISI